MNPTVLIRTETPEQLTQLQNGLDACEGVRAIVSSPHDFVRLRQLDALFLSLPMAENWGSRPIPLHTCEVLRNPGLPELSSFPPYAVTGVLLRPNEEFVGPAVVSLAVRAAVEAVVAFNRASEHPIRLIGFPDIDSYWPGAEWADVGRTIAAGYVEALR